MNADNMGQTKHGRTQSRAEIKATKVSREKAVKQVGDFTPLTCLQPPSIFCHVPNISSSSAFIGG
jgi:hypothetical protein